MLLKLSKKNHWIKRVVIFHDRPKKALEAGFGIHSIQSYSCQLQCVLLYTLSDLSLSLVWFLNQLQRLLFSSPTPLGLLLSDKIRDILVQGSRIV